VQSSQQKQLRTATQLLFFCLHYNAGKNHLKITKKEKRKKKEWQQQQHHQQEEQKQPREASRTSWCRTVLQMNLH
jgi:hypothetical protein